MFIPVGRNIMRWGTPDPEGDWMMYGILMQNDEGSVLVDPPLVPGLLESLEKLGKVSSVVLTTLDHTRGAKYIARKTGATLYVPDQVKSTYVDPAAILKEKEITDCQKFTEIDEPGLRTFRVTVRGKEGSAIPWFDEFAFLTRGRELIVGDIATGTQGKRIKLAPEWFPANPPLERYLPAESVFTKLVRDTGATTLLATHGENLYGTLQDLEFE